MRHRQTTSQTAAAIDRDLAEVTIPRLESMYRSHKYTVTQVTRWYLDRIARYDGVYKALLHIDAAGALATAADLDAAAKSGGPTFKRGPLWGVPIVIKANTSVKGLVTSNGWKGYLIPGHELIAPADAPIVVKLRAAGAVIVGQTNIPDFAAGDTTNSSAGGRTGNAYNWRFSPGGSSGGTVTSVAANFAVFGTGTDTSNSIRMPAGTSNVVGVLPTARPGEHRGHSSARFASGQHGTDHAHGDGRGNRAGRHGRRRPKGLAHDRLGRQGAARAVHEVPQEGRTRGHALRGSGLHSEDRGARPYRPAPCCSTPDAREMFMRALEELRKAGATIVIDETLLPESFLALVRLDQHAALYPRGIGGLPAGLRTGGLSIRRRIRESGWIVAAEDGHGRDTGDGSRGLASEPDAEKTFWGPQKKALAAYLDAFTRFHLDGLVYPSAQMPPNDETIPGQMSSGPHSETGWVNPIGVPAIVVPGGFYPTGLPFGLEFSARPWKDGDLLGWAFAYEQATKHRKPPVLIENHAADGPSNSR